MLCQQSGVRRFFKAPLQGCAWKQPSEFLNHAVSGGKIGRGRSLALRFNDAGPLLPHCSIEKSLKNQKLKIDNHQSRRLEALQNEYGAKHG
jgi:hypothetical protein